MFLNTLINIKKIIAERLDAFIFFHLIGDFVEILTVVNYFPF